jgi:hypothetical protein
VNELSTLAKYIYHQCIDDTHWAATYGTNFREENIPEGTSVTAPMGVFRMIHSTDYRGNFGYRFYSEGVYQIKGVVEGSDFSLLADMANTIDRLFDWQNQIDPSAGRPKSQQVWIDPDDDTVQLMIMSIVRKNPIKYPTFADAVNYCHLGGDYEICYYLM